MTSINAPMMTVRINDYTLTQDSPSCVTLSHSDGQSLDFDKHEVLKISGWLGSVAAIIKWHEFHGSMAPVEAGLDNDPEVPGISWPNGDSDNDPELSPSSSTEGDADNRIDPREELRQLRRHQERIEKEHEQAKIFERFTSGMTREETRWIGITSGIYVGALGALLAVIAWLSDVGMQHPQNTLDQIKHAALLFAGLLGPIPLLLLFGVGCKFTQKKYVRQYGSDLAD